MRRTQSCSFVCWGTPISSNVLGPFPLIGALTGAVCAFTGGGGAGSGELGSVCDRGAGGPLAVEGRGSCCCGCGGGAHGLPLGEGEVGKPIGFPGGRGLNGLRGAEGELAPPTGSRPGCCIPGPGDLGGRGDLGALAMGASNPTSTGGGRCLPSGPAPYPSDPELGGSPGRPGCGSLPGPCIGGPGAGPWPEGFLKGPLGPGPPIEPIAVPARGGYVPAGGIIPGPLAIEKGLSARRTAESGRG